MGKNPRIGIIGYFGHGNAGDEAMREILLQEFPNSVANYRGKMKKCDAYIIAGGDLIQEFTGIHLPMPGLRPSLEDEPRYAISLGVKRGWEKHRELVEREFSKFRMIYTREQESYDILSKFIEVDAVMPDLVLLADAPPSDKKYPIIFSYTTRPWVNPNGQFEDIIEQGNIYPVALSKELDYDTRYSKELIGYKEFISRAKSSQGVIGTRLHAVVMGVIANVPVAGIAYEEKIRKFCQRYEIPCFEYGKENGKEIVSSLKRATINLESERNKIKEVLGAIKSDLKTFFS